MSSTLNNIVKIGQIPFSVVARIYGFFSSLLFRPLDFLLNKTPAGAFLRRYTHEHDCINHIASQAMAMPQNADNLLVHNKRREHAEFILPPSLHPTFYANVPRHLRRSIVEHGRIRETGFAPAPMLAGNVLTESFVEKAYAAAVFSGVRAAWLVFFSAFVFLTVSTVFLLSSGILKSIPHQSTPVAQYPDRVELTRDAAQIIARDYVDVWTSSDASVVAEKLLASKKTGNLAAAWSEKTSSYIAMPMRILLLSIAIMLFSIAAGRAIFLGRFRGLVFSAISDEIANLRKPFREALQKWRYFLADRNTHDRGYNDQVHFATKIDKSPLIRFGDAEGEVEFAGHLLGPREGTLVSQSVVDMLQHTMVLGGSGEAKSRDVYVPVLIQLLELRKQGYPIATYITDDKGAIVEDVLRVATDLNLLDDLLIIGTGPDDWRVDLMEAGKPSLIAEFIKSAAQQAGAGSAGDDFWPEMGNDLMLNIMTVTEAAERTIAGEGWVRESGIRMHSLKNVLTLATVDVELENAISFVVGALQSDVEYVRIADLDNDALYAAMQYLVEFWLPMVDATRDGIRANLRKALRTFTFKPEVAVGFADGAGERLLPASKMHSNLIKVIKISQIEHGSAARLVNVMLKSMFFKQARDVQQQNPAFADDRLAWWFNPDLNNPKKSDFYLEFFLADEYQTLITSDQSSGYSDLTVWNVLRSAGVAGFTISQGLGAYEAAVGREAAGNILRQWRSKHFLRTEDTATIEEAKKIAGKAMRFQVSDWNHYESTAAIRRELGTDPDNLRTAKWTSELSEPAIFSHCHFGEIRFGAWDSAFAVDARFVPQQAARGRPQPLDGSVVLAARQAATWRKEDRQSQTMQHGLLDTEVVRDEQIMQMTRGRSLSFVQVAGGTVVDIVRLNADAYARYDKISDSI